ncbi:7559_t:CDS:2 [Gigaspora rosea]|nr:7559_t:CDS:2 [Gigaspora rosea]
MGIFDPTKPVYDGHENIEEFLVYFEAYAASKDWNDDKKRDLKAAMITSWKTLSDTNEKLERLRNMVQGRGDTVQMYTNCFDAYVQESISGKDHWPTYERAKDLAVKMERYDHDREYISKNPVHGAMGKPNRLNNEEAGDFLVAGGATKVCHVNEGQTDKFNRMETSIVELTKTIQTLIEKKDSPPQPRPISSNAPQNRGNRNRSNGTTLRKCYICEREGHIARDCPNRPWQNRSNDRSRITRNERGNNPDVRNADIRFFEVTEKVTLREEEYLMISVEDDEALFDIRNLVKRGRPRADEATHASKR